MSGGKGKDISDAEYYESQEDFEDIQEYLNMDPITIDEKSLTGFKPDFSSAIIVDTVPVVGEDRLSKLLAALMRVFNQIAKIEESDIHLPLNPETNMTYGFCFVKYGNRADAEKAITVLNGFAFDKKHTFVVSAYGDLDTYAQISPDDKAPSFEFFPKPDTTSWLLDNFSRDQFAIRHSGETEIYWSNTTGEEPNLVYDGEREKVGGKKWCELTVEWSPQGTYFATCHKPGVKLWGGKDFLPLGRFIHSNVEEIAFSPCENYLITYRSSDLESNEAIIVWDVRTAEKIRTFSMKNPLDLKYQVKCIVQEEKNNKKVEREVRGRVSNYHEDNKGAFFTIEEGSLVHAAVSAKTVVPLQDPNKLKWSADGKYCARLGPDIISVYELPSMNLLEKKSIAAKDVLDFVWSPKGNCISYWSPASGNHPAMINIIRVPSRDNICSRKLFDVSEGKMVWQNDGEFLCVHACKTQNKKKTYVLMFFRVKDNGVPVEQLELNDPVINVSWEPSGERVAVMSGDARSPSVSFYSMSCQVPVKPTPGTSSKNTNTMMTKNELTLLFTKAGSQCTDMFWSPAGGIIALAYFPTDGCMFELLDVESNTLLATRKHDRCSKITWDPSGRYLATCTITELRNTHARGQPDDGINFYNFQGNLLCQMKKEKVHGFVWRPRPRDLLSVEERRKIIKNLKKYEKEFEKEDKLRKQELNKEIQANRYKMAQEFIQWRNRNRVINADLKPLRVEIRDGYDSDDDNNYEIEVHVEEQVLKRTEQIVN